MYLIDTDIIIYSFKGNSVVKENLTNHRMDPMAISVITYGEMVYGARRSRQVERNLATVRRVAEIYPVLPVTQSVVETFAEIRAELHATGTPLDDMDLLIAATALSHNLTLVTNNEKHFSRIPGVSLVNWAA
ncbi:MAG: type II toxin-antitoxin system VapC family toxin [Alkalispirochaetaceae bacterium]